MAVRASSPITLHVQVDGSGPPLLALPGFACGGEAWSVIVVRTLAARFRVLRPDWPGTGCSSPIIDGLCTAAALAEAGRRVLDAHAAPRARVLGCGLGALVALQLAVDCPERIERMALIGGAAHGAGLLARAPTVAALCHVAEEASTEEHMLGLLGRLVSPAWRPFACRVLPTSVRQASGKARSVRFSPACLVGEGAGG